MPEILVKQITDVYVFIDWVKSGWRGLDWFTKITSFPLGLPWTDSRWACTVVYYIPNQWAVFTACSRWLPIQTAGSICYSPLGIVVDIARELFKNGQSKTENPSVWCLLKDNCSPLCRWTKVGSSTIHLNSTSINYCWTFYVSTMKIFWELEKVFNKSR